MPNCSSFATFEASEFLNELIDNVMSSAINIIIEQIRIQLNASENIVYVVPLARFKVKQIKTLSLINSFKD